MVPSLHFFNLGSFFVLRLVALSGLTQIGIILAARLIIMSHSPSCLQRWIWLGQVLVLLSLTSPGDLFLSLFDQLFYRLVFKAEGVISSNTHIAQVLSHGFALLFVFHALNFHFLLVLCPVGLLIALVRREFCELTFIKLMYYVFSFDILIPLRPLWVRFLVWSHRSIRNIFRNLGLHSFRVLFLHLGRLPGGHARGGHYPLGVLWGWLILLRW